MTDRRGKRSGDRSFSP